MTTTPLIFGPDAPSNRDSNRFLILPDRIESRGTGQIGIITDWILGGAYIPWALDDPLIIPLSESKETNLLYIENDTKVVRVVLVFLAFKIIKIILSLTWSIPPIASKSTRSGRRFKDRPHKPWRSWRPNCGVRFFSNLFIDQDPGLPDVKAARQRLAGLKGFYFREHWANPRSADLSSVALSSLFAVELDYFQKADGIAYSISRRPLAQVRPVLCDLQKSCVEIICFLNAPVAQRIERRTPEAKRRFFATS